MSLNISVPKGTSELQPRIVVFGVGGAGGNAVNNMIQSELDGVECVVANTDSQALAQSLCDRRVQLGRAITQGLGAGSRPDIGKASAEEGIDDILDHLQGSHMVFITAGMGGGTGTGAAPVIARAAREQGILTVGVVTKPFHFEGPNRMKAAEAGIEELEKTVDTLIVIPNQNLFRIVTEKTTFADAFKMADDVLYAGVRGVTDLMVMPGLINLDFADVRTAMSEMGKAMMGAGEGDGSDRARKAAEKAISNPLLDDVSMKGARGVLVNITGGNDITLYEVDEAVNRIRDEVDDNANIIFGSTFDDKMEGKVRVSIFATGIDSRAEAAKPQPIKIRLVSQDGSVARSGREVAAPSMIEAGDVEPVGDDEPMPLTREHSTGREPESNARRHDNGDRDAGLESVAMAGGEAPAAVSREPRGEVRQFNEVTTRQSRSDTAPSGYGRIETGDAMAHASANAAAAVAGQRLPEIQFEDDLDDGLEAGHEPGYAEAPSARDTDRPNANLFEVLETEEQPEARHEAQPEPRAKTRKLPRERKAAKSEDQDSGGSLGGLDSTDRIASSEDEADLLEIPAFLRRQAN